MKIGIPRALLYYYYYPLWKTFFEEMGCQVVVSRQTTKELIDKGIKHSVPELCVPIKIFNGHVLDLLEQGVDYVYVPRMMQIRNRECFCPKFMGLPDMVRYSLPGAVDKLLFPQVKSDCDDIASIGNFAEMGAILKKSDFLVKEALKDAKRVWNRYRYIMKLGYTAAEALDILENNRSVEMCRYDGEIKIGLMGYVYDIYDEFVSMNIVEKLREMKVDVVTFEMYDEKALDAGLKHMKKKLFWTFSNKLLAAGYKYFEDDTVGGIIHVTAFGCGPDSLIGKLVELESIRYQKPFMTVRVDEHTGENHLLTRIEAFADMLKRKHRAAKKEA